MKSAILLYLLLWALAIFFFLPDSIYIDLGISDDQTIKSAHIFGGERVTGRGWSNELSDNELSGIVQLVDASGVKLPTGRYLVHLTKYTSGNKFLDLVP